MENMVCSFLLQSFIVLFAIIFHTPIDGRSESGSFSDLSDQRFSQGSIQSYEKRISQGSICSTGLIKYSIYAWSELSMKNL